MRYRLSLAIGLALVSCGSSRACLAASPEELEARFLKEAPVAWKAFEEYARNLEVDCTVMNDGLGTMADKIPRAQGDGYHLITSGGSIASEILHPDGTLDAYVVNPAASFVASRKTPSSSATVRWFGKDFGEKTSNLNLSLLQARDVTIGSPASVAGVWLRELIARPGFRVKLVEAGRGGEASLIRVDFDSTANATFPVAGGSLILDPGNSWLIRRVALKIKDQGDANIELSYGDRVGGFSSLRKKTYLLSAPQTPGDAARITAEITRWIQANAPPGRFLLPAYGLPELNQPPSPATPWAASGWWIAAGLACAAVAIGLRIARRSPGPSSRITGASVS